MCLVVADQKVLALAFVNILILVGLNSCFASARYRRSKTKKNIYIQHWIVYRIYSNKMIAGIGRSKMTT